MDQNHIGQFQQAYPLPQDVYQRVSNEMNRMRTDMGRILSEWSADEKRSVFTGPFEYIYCPNALEGATIDEQCRSAVNIGGFTYLVECIHLGSFEMAERLRQAKVNMIAMLVPRETFFDNVMKKGLVFDVPMEWEDLSTFNFLGLPTDVIGIILERSLYPNAQNLALTCNTTNEIYRKSNSTMLLPDLVLLLNFSTEQVQVHWWKQGSTKNPKNVLELDKDNRTKNQIIYNTTELRIETSGDFSEANLKIVRKYLGDRQFKKVVVKADKYTENVKKMVEQFYLDCVELELNWLPDTDLEFPQIKTISIKDTLNDMMGERVFSSKHFINISCALFDIDTLRKALVEWDYGQREIGKWVILKPFTVFQTPFGRRHRCENVIESGYLYFISTLDSTQIPHGEITEYRFQPSD